MEYMENGDLKSYILKNPTIQLVDVSQKCFVYFKVSEPPNASQFAHSLPQDLPIWNHVILCIGKHFVH